MPAYSLDTVSDASRPPIQKESTALLQQAVVEAPYPVHDERTRMSQVKFSVYEGTSRSQELPSYKSAPQGDPYSSYSDS